MSYKILLLLLLMNYQSLSSQELQRPKTVADYCQQLTTGSLDNTRAALKNEICTIDSLLKWADKSVFSLSIGFSFGTSGEDEYKKQSISSVEPYTPPLVDLQNIKAGFLKYPDCFHLSQMCTNGSSELSAKIDQTNIPADVQKLFDDGYEITQTIKTIYRNGQMVMVDELGLSQADSAEVLFSLSVPLSVKTIFIQKNKTSVTYNNTTLNAFRFDRNNFEIDLPVAINEKVLAYQALNKQGKRMNSSSKSNYSLMTVSPAAVEYLHGIKHILEKGLVADNQADIRTLLSTITELQLDHQNKLMYVYHQSKESELTVEQFNRFFTQEQMASLWSADQMRIEAEFPDNIETLVLYIADKTEVYQKKQMIHTQGAQRFHIHMENAFDKSLGKVCNSLIDNVGQVVAYFPNSVSSVVHFMGNYYNCMTNGKYTMSTYWFNEKENRIELLPYHILTKLNDSLILGLKDVASGKHEWGILSYDNPYKEMLPFKDQNICKLGTYIIAKPQEGLVEFYDSKLKRIENMNYEIPHIDISEGEAAYAPVRNVDNQKMGVLNKSLQLTVPCMYRRINAFGDHLLKAQNMASKYGVIDFNNKIVVPFDYEDIEYEEELFIFRKNDKGGYMNRAYKEVIAPQFDSNNQFFKGYALVKKGNTYGIINRQGKYVMQERFSSTNGSYSCFYQDHGGVVYRINGKCYDYKGILIK